MPTSFSSRVSGSNAQHSHPFFSHAQVAGAQDKKKDSEELSNHEEILKGLHNSGYVTVFKAVDPSNANIPCSRARVHYIGVHKQFVGNGGEENFVSMVQALWSSVVEDAGKVLPQHRLDAFLYGDSRDPALPDVPSVQRFLAKWDGPHLPIASDDVPQPPKKRQKCIRWPALHEQMVAESGEPWLCRACFHFRFVFGH